MGAVYFWAGITTYLGAIAAYQLLGPISYPLPSCPDWVRYSGGTC